MNTQFITTTELREQSSIVVDKLKLGEEMLLIHRSNIIGVIMPLTKQFKTITNIDKFKKDITASKPKRIIPRYLRETIYRKNLLAKYG